jgi:hypothetical protein
MDADRQLDDGAETDRVERRGADDRRGPRDLAANGGRRRSSTPRPTFPEHIDAVEAMRRAVRKALRLTRSGKS